MRSHAAEETTVQQRITGTFAAALLVSACRVVAHADYPDRPIQIICAYAAGGGGDLMVRWYANALKDLTGSR